MQSPKEVKGVFREILKSPESATSYVIFIIANGSQFHPQGSAVKPIAAKSIL